MVGDNREDAHACDRSLVDDCPGGTRRPPPAKRELEPSAAHANVEVEVVENREDVHARARRLVDGRPDGTHRSPPAGQGLVTEPGAARASAEMVGDDREDLRARARKLVDARPGDVLFVVQLLVLVMSAGPYVNAHEDGDESMWAKMRLGVSVCVMCVGSAEGARILESGTSRGRRWSGVPVLASTLAPPREYWVAIHSPTPLWEVGNGVFGSRDGSLNNLPVARARGLGTDESRPCWTCCSGRQSEMRFY